jgi:hypothetical protein
MVECLGATGGVAAWVLREISDMGAFLTGQVHGPLVSLRDTV